MDNQNTPFQPQNDNPQPDPAPQQAADHAPSSHGPASAEEVEAARAAFQAAMKKEYADSQPPQQAAPAAPQVPQPQPQPPQDNVDSYQIPSMPQAETLQPQTPEQQQPEAAPTQRGESPHTIQNFTRRRHPGDEQTTRMNPGGGYDATMQPIDASQAPPQNTTNGNSDKAPIPPPQETIIGEAPHTPPQAAPQATSSEAPGYVDNTHIFTQQTEEQPPATQSFQQPPTTDTPTDPPTPEQTQSDWHIKPAFSQGVIGVGEQNSNAPYESPQVPPDTSTPPVAPPIPQQAESPAGATPTEPAPVAQPTQPSPPQSGDQGSFQIPQTAPQAPAPPEAPAPPASPEHTSTNPSPQPMPDLHPSTDSNTEKTAPANKGAIKQFFTKIKSFNYKPFVSAGLMGIAVFAVFNSQVLLGQIQYITTPSGGVETAGVVSGESTVGDENKIIIPKINVDVPVVYDITTFDEDAVQQGLERGVVHYGTTAMPGEIGNNVIVGHSSNNWWDSGEYKFAFILLDRLDDGDEIILHYEGTRYVYEVSRSFVVDPTDVSVLEQGDDSIITLITCTPPGTSWQRLIVQAEQVTPDPDNNVERGADREIPDELPSDLPRDNTGGFMQFMRGLF